MNKLLPLGQGDLVNQQDHFHQVDPGKQTKMNRAVYQTDALKVTMKGRIYLWSRISTRSGQPRWATSTL